MIHHSLVEFYRLWHGTFHMKGAGYLLTRIAAHLKELQEYKLYLPEGQGIDVDFRDVSAMYWLNYLLKDTFEEKGLLAAIRPFLSTNDVFWDIGANSGLLSYSLLKSVKLGGIHMFEPNPKMGSLATQAMKPFDNIKIHLYGLSDISDDLFLTIPDGHSTMGTLEPLATARKGRQCEVTCRVGDELVFNCGFQPPRVMKIDTEGHELKVLSGLSKTIHEYRPVIFFEHISLNSDELWSIVPEKYSLFTVSDATGDLIQGFNSNIGHNSALIPH